MQFVRVAWMAAALAAFGCEDPEPESVVRTPMIEEPGDERATPDGNSGRRPGTGDEEERGNGDRGDGDRGDGDRGNGDARNGGGNQGGANPGGGGQARKPPPGDGKGGKAGKKPPPGKPGVPMEKPAGIHQVSATKWTVTRGLADHWMKNPYALGNVREAGAGWQLVGVRGKAGYWLGMKNGDVIMQANGHKLDTRPQLLAAYLDLKNDRTFRVTFVRDGQTMVHTYQIVEGAGGGGKK